MPNVYVSQHNGKLTFVHNQNYESRGASIETMIRKAIIKYNILYDFSFAVFTEDKPTFRYSFSTIDKQYNLTFPCFAFDGWKEAGLNKYEDCCSSFINTAPETSKIGWIGSCGPNGPEKRKEFISKFQDKTDFLDIIVISWNTKDPKNLPKYTPEYLSLQQQIDKWKYLLDIEGCGWSARTKYLIRSPRIVFIIERPYEEYFYQFLKPWIHYVPVKRDFSDLKENYLRIETDISLQNFISKNQKEFSSIYLSEDAVLKRIRDVISDNKI